MRLKLRQEKYVRIVHEVDQGKQIPGRENSINKSKRKDYIYKELKENSRELQ